MRFKKKKGFTIIELVIVIAVIGILTAILVPTFINLTNKANEAADQSLVKNLNTTLSVAEADIQKGYKKPSNPTDMFEILKGEGYIGETLIRDQRSGKKILYNLNKNRFLFEENKTSAEYKNFKDEDFWTFGLEVDTTGYSTYLFEEYNSTAAINITSGLDVGANDEVTSITYTSSVAKKVVIRTNGGSLTISAASDTVNHYGEAEILDIQAINTASYHEFGKVGLARLKQGHFVVEAEGVVNVLYATGPKSGDTRVVVDNNNGTVGKAYATVTETANIYNGDAQEGQSGNVVLEKYDAVITQAVVTAMNSESIVEILASEDSSVAAVKETIEAAVESSAFLGEGTEANPYIISSVNDLVKLSQKVAGGNSYEGEWFALSKDIDMKDVLWGADQGEDTINCIGLKSGTKFSGNFDGKGYTISNLSNGDKVTADTYTAPTSQTTGNIFGLFGYVSGNVTIKNLTLIVNADVPAGKACGGLISNVVAGSTLNISGVTVSGNLYARNEKAAGFIGATNSENSTITLTNCTNKVNVTTKERGAGFISQIGNSDSVSFINCHNEGKIELTKTNDIFDATEYGVAAGFVSHINGGTINYDDKSSNTGTIIAPLAANYHTYAGALLYTNHEWKGKTGNTSAITIRENKGVIISESSESYARVAEAYLKAPNAFDGIYYNSENTYGVIFNHASLSSNSNGADSKYATYDDLANYYKNNWNSGNTFTLQSNQSCSKTISVAGGGWTYKANLNGHTLTTTVSILTAIDANYSGTSHYVMTIENGTIAIDSSSTITSLFGPTNSEYLVLTNVTIVNNTDHAINVNGTSVAAGDTLVIGATN